MVRKQLQYGNSGQRREFLKDRLRHEHGVVGFLGQQVVALNGHQKHRALTRFNLFEVAQKFLARTLLGGDNDRDHARLH